MDLVSSSSSSSSSSSQSLLCPHPFQPTLAHGERFPAQPQPFALQLGFCRRREGASSCRQNCRFRARCLRQEEENEKFFSSSPSGGSPSKQTPPFPESLGWDFEDDLDVPLVRSESPRGASSTNEYIHGRRTSGSPRGSSSNDEYKYGRRTRIPPKQEEISLLTGKNKFIVAGIFVLGIGAGIAMDSGLNVEPSNVASREVIDRQTPNPDICLANGMSAMVLDHRLFITFNPFNVFVSQAEVKPGCVLRQSNWFVLESRGLVSPDESRDCKRNMNTFGFVGDLRQAPEITCVYHSESAENQFLKDPAKAALGDGFQPKTFDD